jgi:hypothetical protein
MVNVEVSDDNDRYYGEYNRLLVTTPTAPNK